MSAPDPLRQTRASGLPIDEQGYCYLDQKHFDQIVRKTAIRLAWKHRPTLLRLVALPTAIWGLWFGFAIVAVFFNISVPFAFVLIFAALLIQSANYKRFAERITRDQMCFGCGYQLIGARVDADGWGKCPECARGFNLAEYRRPPRDYQRILWQPRPTKAGYPSIDTGRDWLHPDDEARLSSKPS